MRRALKVIIIIFSFWLVVNLGSWLILGWLVKGIVVDSSGSFEKTQKRVGQLQFWLHWYPYLSLGTYRLPYVYPMYGLIDTATYTLGKGVNVAESLEKLGIPALQGQKTDWQDWKEVFVLLSPLDDSLQELNEKLKDKQVVSLVRFTKNQSQYEQIIDSIEKAHNLLASFVELEPALPKILGYEGKQHYVVLTQNNMELWPTGGYLGSYAEFWMNEGAMENLRAEASDVPNGQLQGYVESPEPIVKYTHNGETPGWRLRESNWNPDFPKAMETIEWFFIKGGVEPIDGMIATNLYFVIDVIGALGSLELPDFNLTLTSDNFYLETQKHTSYDFFKGSTQKRSFLNYTSGRLIDELLANPKENVFSLAKVIYQNLQEKQVLVAMKDKNSHIWFEKQGWDGSLGPIECVGKDNACFADYIHINEANLGINKANCCIERQFTDTVLVTNPNTVIHNLKLLYINNNPKYWDPPNHWGAKYESYTRLYVPGGSKLLSITKDGKPLDPELIDLGEVVDDKSVIAFLVYVEGGEQGVYEVSYEVDFPDFFSVPTSYQQLIQKQSGIDFIPWKIISTYGDDKNVKDLRVDRDVRLEFDLVPK